MTAEEIARVQVGRRVRTRFEIDRFPDFLVPAGATGVIAAAGAGLVAVLLDEPTPGAEPWGNELHFYGGVPGSFWEGFPDSVQFLED